MKPIYTLLIIYIFFCFNLPTQDIQSVQKELQNRCDEIEHNCYHTKNYELVFKLCAIQDKQLQKVSSQDIPLKARYYLQIANLHYWFKDYSKAIYYFNTILKIEDNIENLIIKQHARNGLGLSYSERNELDRADSCYRSMIFEPPFIIENDPSFDIWEGVAKGNIACNMIQREEYDYAILFLKSSIEIMLKHKDYAFISGRAADLVNVYLKKGDIKEAKRYIDFAIEWRNTTRIPRHAELFFEAMSRYYAAVGNKELCIVYMDSMLQAKKQKEEQFNATVLLRMEQRELVQQQQELAREKEIRRAAQFRVWILSVAFVFISVLLGLMFFLYRKKRAAYRELVHKSQEWAQSAVGYADRDVVRNISTTDQQLFEQLQLLLQQEYMYRDPAITIDKLALKMKVNRTYLSRAINQCTEKNFSSFINEYRIKEAILLMSADAEKYSFEGLGYEVGFNDRKTFYTAFKKITGLSPSDFRSNLTV